MGIKITGDCRHCHRTGTLDAEGGYCSDQCKSADNDPPLNWIDGCVHGAIWTAIICVVIGTIIYITCWPTERIQHEKMTEQEKRMRDLQNYENAAVVMRAMADSFEQKLKIERQRLNELEASSPTNH